MNSAEPPKTEARNLVTVLNSRNKCYQFTFFPFIS